VAVLARQAFLWVGTGMSSPSTLFSNTTWTTPTDGTAAGGVPCSGSSNRGMSGAYMSAISGWSSFLAARTREVSGCPAEV
jgi:hypothetical protein